MSDVEKVIYSKGTLRCPNHNCPLVDFGFPMKAKGTAVCPQSKAKFEYECVLEEGESEDVVDKYGNKYKAKTYKITGED